MPDTLPQKPHSRIASLDGLRGIAIWLVLSWHLLPHWVLFSGWAGVDLFFVLSGYLITGRLLATKDKPHYLTHFYRNRALRIFPLYFSLVIAFLLAVRFLLSSKNLPLFEGYLVHWKSFFIFTENWTFIRYPIPADISLLPLWSIAVEMQFYLIWPFVILLTPTPKIRQVVFQVLLAIVIITRIVYAIYFPDSRLSIYFNTFFRIEGFIMGSLLCQLHKKHNETHNKTQNETNKNFTGPYNKYVVPTLALLAVILLAVPIATHDASIANAFYPMIGYTLLALFFTLLLHLALQPGDPLPLLKNRFLQRSGRISFCLYLIHFPLLSALYPRLDAMGTQLWPGHQGFFYCLTVLITLVLSFAISLFSYRYFESYFLRLKR